MRLAPERAPAAATPRRFLLSVPLWGVLAAIILISAHGEALASRWQPATLALTHACTLGVLGNAMFGSLLQFLPAAARVRVRGGARTAHVMHAALNLGTLLLVGAFLTASPRWLAVAAAPLLLAFVVLAAMTLPGLYAACDQRLLRAGLALAILGGGLAAVLGGGAALAAGGRLALPLPWLVDVHAAWGAIGWVLLLLAVVAREVLPMFLGSGRWPAWFHLLALLGLPAALVAASLPALRRGDVDGLRLVATLAAGAFATGGGWLLWRSRPRNAALGAYWGVGLLALCGASLALIVAPGTLLAGVLGLGVAAPLLVTGMLLEICAFIAWIDLHRHARRGVRVPPIQRLLPSSDKWSTLRAMIAAAAMLAIATVYPSRLLAVLAGVAWLLAWLHLAWALFGVQRRAAALVREWSA